MLEDIRQREDDFKGEDTRSLVHIPSGKALAESWGWSVPTADVLAQAEKAANCHNRSIKDVIIKASIMPESEYTSLVIGKPKDANEFDWLCQNDATIASNSQYIRSLQLGVQYIPDLDTSYLQPHPEMLSDNTLMKECETYNCVLIQIQMAKPALVFADATDSLRKYRQMAGPSLAMSAIRKRFPDVPLAVSRREQVMTWLKQAINAGHSASEDTSRIIYSHALKTDSALQKLANIHDLSIEKGATDIHLKVTPMGIVDVYHRVFGELNKVPEQISPEQYNAIVNYLLRQSGARLKSERVTMPLDGSYQYGYGQRIVNTRCSFIPYGHTTILGQPAISVVIRLLPMESGAVRLRDKNVHAKVIHEIDLAVRPSQGMVLLVGPTGSGKSTTIAGIIEHHREIFEDKKNRLSVEDPVERFIPGVEQIQIPNNLRGTGKGFSTISRNFMRHDPDMIFLGEIRDEETAEYATHFATTGHLVLSTLHADSPLEAVTRLMNMLPVDKPSLRSSAVKTVNLIIGQRLVQRICPHCSKVEPVTNDELNQFKNICALRGLKLDPPTSSLRKNIAGCSKCYKGVKGMIPVNETLVMTREIKDAVISESPDAHEIAKSGLRTKFEEVIIELIKENKASFDALMF